VYFGSAVNNFGIELLLNGFLQDSVPPAPRKSVAVTVPGAPAPTTAREVPVDDPKFSGFIFKIQANMDAKHRDRIAFLRVCSGKFERDMVVTHQRTGKQVRLSSSHKLFGRERETVDVAWPGDVIGLVGHSEFGIGDTLTTDRGIYYDEIPRVPSEVFTYITNPNTGDAKKYRAGVEQLLQEGVVQSFSAKNAPPGATLLAAVGPLQFEVVQWRLQSEYGADSRLTPTPWTTLRWLSRADGSPMTTAKGGPDFSKLIVATGVSFGTDKFDHPIALFPNEWSMRYFTDKNPELKLLELPPEQAS
jgi:peptide chain release factor 3